MVTLTAIPVGAIEALAGSALPPILEGIKAGKSAHDIVAGMEPAVVSLIETVADILLPGAGQAVGVVAWIIEHAEPQSGWTAADLQRLRDWADGTSRDGAGQKTDGW